jgi:hypothetical protein
VNANPLAASIFGATTAGIVQHEIVKKDVDCIIAEGYSTYSIGFQCPIWLKVWILIGTCGVQYSGCVEGIRQRPRFVFPRNDIIVMQHRVGCRVCGAKSSSRFRDWRSYSHLEGFEGVEFRVLESDVICDKCHQASRRGTLKVSPTLSQFARSSPFVFPL